MSSEANESIADLWERPATASTARPWDDVVMGAFILTAEISRQIVEAIEGIDGIDYIDPRYEDENIEVLSWPGMILLTRSRLLTDWEPNGNIQIAVRYGLNDYLIKYRQRSKEVLRFGFAYRRFLRSIQTYEYFFEPE